MAGTIEYLTRRGEKLMALKSWDKAFNLKDGCRVARAEVVRL